MSDGVIYENKLIRIELEPAEVPWLKIFSQQDAKEFSDCDATTQQEIFRLLVLIEKEMLVFYQPEKINIASFANYLPKVHWHVMARFKEDSYFPEPMWGVKQRQANLHLPPIADFVQQLVPKLK